MKKESGENVAGGDGHKPMQIASKFSLGVKLAIDDGSVRIEEVIEGSAAERDGLKNGDLLQKANGKALDGRIDWHALTNRRPHQLRTHPRRQNDDGEGETESAVSNWFG